MIQHDTGDGLTRETRALNQPTCQILTLSDATSVCRPVCKCPLLFSLICAMRIETPCPGLAIVGNVGITRAARPTFHEFHRTREQALRALAIDTKDNLESYGPDFQSRRGEHTLALGVAASYRMMFDPIWINSWIWLARANIQMKPEEFLPYLKQTADSLGLDEAWCVEYIRQIIADRPAKLNSRDILRAYLTGGPFTLNQDILRARIPLPVRQVDYCDGSRTFHLQDPALIELVENAIDYFEAPHWGYARSTRRPTTRKQPKLLTLHETKQTVTIHYLRREGGGRRLLSDAIGLFEEWTNLSDSISERTFDYRLNDLRRFGVVALARNNSTH